MGVVKIECGSLTLSEEEARSAGLLPGQIAARARRQVRILERLPKTAAVVRLVDALRRIGWA